ncbi:hypothetical protein [Lewinella sp. IMCC34183]|uniref:hypothetical protein n=1 Tax=Lewinella sp. IMCC34183 TaxID=2248762 RepID=UPI000E21F551|nr:hypothetical protein [Lewinella sp. IMCC34183]
MSYDQFKPFAPAAARRATASDSFFVDVEEPLYLVGGVTGVFGVSVTVTHSDDSDLHCICVGERIDAAPLDHLAPSDCPAGNCDHQAASRHDILAPVYFIG